MRIKREEPLCQRPLFAFLKSTNIFLSVFGCVCLSLCFCYFLSRTFVHRAAPAVDTAPTIANVPIVLRIFLVFTTVTSIKDSARIAKNKRERNDFRVGPTKTVARWVPSFIKLLLGGTPSCLTAGFSPASIHLLLHKGICKICEWFQVF